MSSDRAILLRPSSASAWSDEIRAALAMLPSPVDCTATKSKSVGKFVEYENATVVFNLRDTTTIAFLLNESCPTAVSRFVVADAFDSVDAVGSRWTRTHVFKESLESAWTSPSITDGDSGASVSGKSIALNVVTTTIHPAPDSIFGRLSIPGVSSVLEVATESHLSAHAPARPRESMRQERCSDVVCSSAVARAMPCSVLSLVWGTAHNNEPSEAFANEVKSTHNSIMTNRGPCVNDVAPHLEAMAL
jgi:hypothetical protein